MKDQFAHLPATNPTYQNNPHLDDAENDRTQVNLMKETSDDIFGVAEGAKMKDSVEKILRKSQLSSKKSERMSVPAIGSSRNDYNEVD
jgi:ribosomal protein S16